MVQEIELIEIDIDGRTQKVRPHFAITSSA
jgi:hypothetical protein